MLYPKNAYDFGAQEMLQQSMFHREYCLYLQVIQRIGLVWYAEMAEIHGTGHSHPCINGQTLDTTCIIFLACVCYQESVAAPIE